MNSFLELLNKAFQKNQIDADLTIQNKMRDFISLLLKWNSVYNLTSITEPRDIVDLHIIDSLSIRNELVGSHFLDVGSGGGFPAIPLAILYPEHHWTLIDKVRKKTQFLTQAILELELKNVMVLNQNIFDFSPKKMFDVITARALSTCQDFLNLSAHCGDAHTLWIAMKGQFPETELNDIPDNFYLDHFQKLKIVNRDIERHALIFKKK